MFELGEGGSIAVQQSLPSRYMLPGPTSKQLKKCESLSYHPGGYNRKLKVRWLQACAGYVVIYTDQL
jgi:hypothetical protein